MTTSLQALQKQLVRIAPSAILTVYLTIYDIPYRIKITPEKFIAHCSFRVTREYQKVFASGESCALRVKTCLSSF